MSLRLIRQLDIIEVAPVVAVLVATAQPEQNLNDISYLVEVVGVEPTSEEPTI